MRLEKPIYGMKIFLKVAILSMHQNKTTISIANKDAFGKLTATIPLAYLPCTNNSISYDIFNINYDVGVFSAFNTSVIINENTNGLAIAISSS